MMPLFFPLCFYRLFIQSDSFARASTCAGATLDAFIGVDFVDVTFGDGSDGALVHTSTASSTFVRNFVSHS